MYGLPVALKQAAAPSIYDLLEEPLPKHEPSALLMGAGDPRLNNVRQRGGGGWGLAISRVNMHRRSWTVCAEVQ